jgi:hypothetical protein
MELQQPRGAASLVVQCTASPSPYLFRPRSAIDDGIQLIVPSFSNLLCCARGQVNGHFAPGFECVMSQVSSTQKNSSMQSRLHACQWVRVPPRQRKLPSAQPQPLDQLPNNIILLRSPRQPTLLPASAAARVTGADECCTDSALAESQDRAQGATRWLGLAPLLVDWQLLPGGWKQVIPVEGQRMGIV